MTIRIKPFYNDIRDFHHDVYSPENSDMLQDQHRQEQLDIIDSQWDAILHLDLEKLTGR